MAGREKSLKERLLEDEEDPAEASKAAGRDILRRQREAAEQQTKRLEEKKLADKVRVADAFGLSPEEKDTYLNRELGKDSLKARVSQSPAAEAKPYTVPAEPLVLAPKEDTATPTMDDTVEDTKLAAGSEYGDAAKKQLAMANRLLNEANKLPAHDREFFRQRVQEAQNLFKEAEGKLEQRELAEKFAHALTQLGAGMHGLKTGTDMSGLQFDKTDWTKKLELQLGKFRDALDAVRDEDRMARAEGESRRSSLVSQANVAAGMAGTLAAADSRQAAAQAAADAKKEREGLKSEKAQRDAYIKRKADWDKFQASLKNAKNLDPDITVSQLRSRAIALGGNASEIDTLIKKAKGWGGLDEADAKDAAALINDYVATLPEPTFSAAQAPQAAAGEIERLDKNTGKVAVFDAETKKFKRWK